MCLIKTSLISALFTQNSKRTFKFNAQIFAGWIKEHISVAGQFTGEGPAEEGLFSEAGHAFP